MIGQGVMEIWKKFFTMREVRHWQRLPREAVDAPPVVFKARLDGAWPGGRCAMTRRLEQGDL